MLQSSFTTREIYSSSRDATAASCDPIAPMRTADPQLTSRCELSFLHILDVVLQTQNLCFLEH